MKHETYTHHNISDLDAFAGLKAEKAPVYSQSPRQGIFVGDGYFEQVPDCYAIVNGDGKPISNKTVSKNYKLVPHLEMFRQQAKQINESPLPDRNVTVVDTVLDGGVRATREIRFNEIRLDLKRLDGTDDGQVARMDTVNSIDMSWAFQAFAGAYRAYCRNGQVFAGSSVYQAKRKHTKNLNPSALTANSLVGIETFHKNRDLFKRYQTIDLDRSEWVEIMEQTLCKATSRGAIATSDQTKKVNLSLLGQMVGRFDEEVAGVGSNLWAGYNALTAWSTHVQEEREYETTDKNGHLVTRVNNVRTVDERVPHVRLQRQAKVRDVLNSSAWSRQLATAS